MTLISHLIDNRREMVISGIEMGTVGLVGEEEYRKWELY